MNQVEESGEGLYQVDIPLTLEKQRALLLEAGSVQVEVLWEEGEASVYVAKM
jgi:hypothetical protein